MKDFKKKFAYDLVKWLFTAVIAAVPILFISLHNLLFMGRPSYIEVVAHGELFILSIVMVAEPLGDLVMSPIKNTLSLVYTLMIILVLVTSGFYYSHIKNNQSRIEHCLKESHKEDNSKCQVCSLTSQLGVVKDSIKVDQIKSEIEKQHNKHLHLSVPITDRFLEELSWASKWVVGIAFLLGIVSVLHLTLLEHRTGIKHS